MKGSYPFPGGSSEGVHATAVRIHQLTRPARMIVANLALQSLVESNAPGWAPESQHEHTLAYVLCRELLLLEQIPGTTRFRLTQGARKALGAMMFALLEADRPEMRASDDRL